jgi:hypothetical protein
VMLLLRKFPAMKIPINGALRFANSTLRQVNCFVESSLVLGRKQKQSIHCAQAMRSASSISQLIPSGGGVGDAAVLHDGGFGGLPPKPRVCNTTV